LSLQIMPIRFWPNGFEEAVCGHGHALASPIAPPRGPQCRQYRPDSSKAAGFRWWWMAGIGVPGEAAQAMEMGADCPCGSTAAILPGRLDPAAMAEAMAMATEAVGSPGGLALPLRQEARGQFSRSGAGRPGVGESAMNFPPSMADRQRRVLYLASLRGVLRFCR